MKTKFSIISEGDFPGRWARLYHAGTDWLILNGVLDAEPKEAGGSYLFYVRPFVAGFAFELFLKSVVAQTDPSFNPMNRRYGHHTANIIEDYKARIPVLEKISRDSHLMRVVAEYEKTIYSKFGDTYMSIDRGDQKLLLDAAFEMREVVRLKAGFRN